MKITEVTFIGHSGVLFEAQKIDGTRFVIAIDPWMSGNPVCPESLYEPEQLDLIILTHGHSDHAGDASRLARHYAADVISTYELGLHLQSEGIHESRCITMNKGGTTTTSSGLTISLTNAFHSNSYEVNGKFHYAGEACGIVLKADNITIYHAGDTCLFSDMSLIKDRWNPDVCFLPIGDRFTMGPEDAALATRILAPERVVPIHHSTFDLLTGTPEAYKKALDDLKLKVEVSVLEPGESLSL